MPVHCAGFNCQNLSPQTRKAEHFTDGSSAQPHQVVAVVGDAVTLPCSLEDRTRFDDSPTVEWTRPDLEPKAALVYRDNSEVFEMKHQRFEFRTSLFHSEVKDGNVSLRISNVQLSDAGMFYCLKIPKEEGRLRMENSTVELVVVSVSDPKISMVAVQSGAVMVECAASCWLPKPEMKILDDQGRTLTAEKTETEEPNGCITVRQKVVLQNSTGRFTCRAELLQFNHSRSAQIHITVGFLWSGPHIASICAVEALVFVALFALWHLFGMKCPRPASQNVDCRKSSSVRSSSVSSNTCLSPENQNQESGEGNRNREHSKGEK
ncbi:butyrophilin subfamily 1 member A1-like isoform X3 [Oryzias latipes]|uniref:butyrophilin subfamily 1 member A1-like isoform X3 n=1 Tax=Oryzias latipes TaxID=8090 RepID=UPI000CE2065B|nr:butyrophilin subfamily 1 member A1-like isoform X3 [Oryzias latipes]